MRRRFRHTSHHSRHFRREELRYSPGTSLAIGLFSAALIAMVVAPRVAPVKELPPRQEPGKES
jgi:hypothetical protein